MVKCQPVELTGEAAMHASCMHERHASVGKSVKLHPTTSTLVPKAEESMADGEDIPLRSRVGAVLAQLFLTKAHFCRCQSVVLRL